MTGGTPTGPVPPGRAGAAPLGPGEWTCEWVFHRHAQRFDATLDHIRARIDAPGYRILDLGGDQFLEAFRGTGTEYVMLDLETPMAVTQGGYFGNPEGLTYDGRTLPFPPGRFDMVVAGFVFHHAAQHTIGLLRQIRDIAVKRVLVLEDLASPDYPRGWLDRNARHQPGGVFRDDIEWRALFDLTGFDLERAIVLRLPGDPGDRPYRVLYDMVPRPKGARVSFAAPRSVPLAK